jgi:hypothetical protein
MDYGAMSNYYAKLAHKLAVGLLIIGALNWGLIGAMRVNFVERLLGKGPASRGIAIALAFNRDTYLPFLGESVFPCSVLTDQVPAGATRAVQVQVTPGAKVIYWASEPVDSDGSVPNFEGAYRQYLNAGVTTADDTGLAVLKVREPQPYTVPIRGQLDSHVHFRVCGPNGFIGRIKTVFVSDGRVEGFQ